MDKKVNTRCVERWIENKHKKNNYYFTQFLTGNGSFGTFTPRIRKTTDDMCQKCGVTNRPEHAYTVCARWQREREAMVEKLRRMPPVYDVIPQMREDENTWRVVYEFVVGTMIKKEREDRMA